jgi:hypothetical protein
MNGASLTVAVARGLSALGHPVVVMPAAVLVLLLHLHASSVVPIILALCVIAGTVLVFSFWQVHRGRWQHVDASATRERRTLNLFLAIVLSLAAIVTFARAAEPGFTLGLSLSGLLIVLAMLASRWIKLSLHASFAAFAVVLLWPLGFWYVAIAALVAASICWSRVFLGRHTVIEAVAGSLLGAVMGACFWLAPRWHG